MLRIALVGMLFFSALVVFASPRVPSDYSFADIKLHITEAARREIQADVDALHQSPTYFDKKLEKVRLYFPIIERVLAEENVPDDFKYLVIQESALIADAVSVSNAVGFWQFKEVSAKEVGLRVDRYIDERMHITASTHAAAKYLKKNNFFFDNWLYALLAYNTGPGGAEAHVEKKFMGKKKMEINKSTHWYVKKYLAHKVAFEQEIVEDVPLPITLFEYRDTGSRSLDEIAKTLNIEYQKIADYNKWLHRGKIPSDKTYLVIVPVTRDDHVARRALDRNYKEPTTTPAAEAEAEASSKIIFTNTYKPAAEFDFNINEGFPKISRNNKNQVKVNGIPGFTATSEDVVSGVPTRYGMSVSKFRKFNELATDEELAPGTVYYLKAKKSKAKVHYHVVMPGENAWSISQKYGIKVKKLLTKNRIREEKDLEAGMVLWLRFIRPKSVPVEYRELPMIEEPQQQVIEATPKDADLVHQENAQPDQSPKTTQDEITVKEDMEAVDDAYFFDEVSEGPAYIDENSFVEIKNSTSELSAERVDVQASNNVQNKDIYHIVKSGETLFAISRMYDASIGQLRQWNNIDDLNVLKVGQRILIKKEGDHNPLLITTPLEQQTTTYRVKQDDTLYSIARKHGISVEELMDLNKREDFTLEEGEVLIIKSSD